jgi:guanylate kinase
VIANLNNNINEHRRKITSFSAPSGSGKTTIVKHLLGQKKIFKSSNFRFRQRQENPEVKKQMEKDYYCISTEFKNFYQNEDFLEWKA